MRLIKRDPDSYEKIVIRGANSNGDSDSIATIGGSIADACHGIRGIPQNWISKIEKSTYLDGLSARLAEKKEGI